MGKDRAWQCGRGVGVGPGAGGQSVRRSMTCFRQKFCHATHALINHEWISPTHTHISKYAVCVCVCVFGL